MLSRGDDHERDNSHHRNRSALHSVRRRRLLLEGQEVAHRYLFRHLTFPGEARLESCRTEARWMPRAPRTLVGGAVSHVYARLARGEGMLADDGEASRLVEILSSRSSDTPRPAYFRLQVQYVSSLIPACRHTSFTGRPLSAWRRTATICSSVLPVSPCRPLPAPRQEIAKRLRTQLSPGPVFGFWVTGLRSRGTSLHPRPSTPPSGAWSDTTRCCFLRRFLPTDTFARLAAGVRC